jgi:hypothetical protein
VRETVAWSVRLGRGGKLSGSAPGTRRSEVTAADDPSITSAGTAGVSRDLDDNEVVQLGRAPTIASCPADRRRTGDAPARA